MKNNTHFILQTFLIANLLLSATRSIQASDAPYADEVVKARENLLDKLIENFQFGNNQLPNVNGRDKFFIQQELTIEQKKIVKNALQQSFNVEGLCRMLSDATFHIAFVPAKYLDDLTHHPGMVTFFYTKINTVLIDDFLISDEKHFDQLVATLNYAMSCALNRRTKIRKLSNQCEDNLCQSMVKDSNYWEKTLYPWVNPAEAESIETALAEYEKNVKEFRELSMKSNRLLEFEERQKLAKFNKAIEHYQPTPSGRESLTSAQFFTSNKNEFDAVTSNRKPPAKIKELKKYNGNLFYREFQNIKFQIETTGTYYNQDKNQLMAKEISFFSTLHPKIQKVFGEKLCQEMDKVHQLVPGTFCSKKR